MSPSCTLLACHEGRGRSPSVSEKKNFSCIAGLVRDMVGQQLELVEIETNFPEKGKQQRSKPTNQHPHPSQAPGQAEKPGKFANKVKQVKQTRPSQPLKGSLPPCSNPPCCPCLDVSHINICTWILRRVSNVWQRSSLELIRTLSSLPPFCAILHECINFRLCY